MICAYYNNGYCNSPIAPKKDVTSRLCFSNFRKCQYFGEVIEVKELNLRQKVKSDCPYFLLKDQGGEYVPFCRVLNFRITESQAANCSLHWQSCPLRELAEVG
ncbi:MAG: hypothetical protein TQ35_0004645 [Candidatus Aramenus sulfurataquae]|uniref:Uncharacterized protein n=3 Tax=Candidatus Aramenus sulfurataquae TaxID=1326980 RepID=A0AAE3K234_9CREN|nr:hypothetical protein [Candidatus Aramenus sulfurataquae]